MTGAVNLAPGNAIKSIGSYQSTLYNSMHDPSKDTIHNARVLKMRSHFPSVGEFKMPDGTMGQSQIIGMIPDS